MVNKVLEVSQPVHVESLIFIQRHAFNKGCQVLIETKSCQVIKQRVLDSFIKSHKLRACIVLKTSLESVRLELSIDVLGDHHWVDVNLSVHGCALSHNTFFTFINEHSKVAIVFGWSLSVLVIFILGFFVLLEVFFRNWLSINDLIKGGSYLDSNMTTTFLPATSLESLMKTESSTSEN